MHIYLHGLINPDSSTLARFSHEFDFVLKKRPKNITIEICSEGGDVYSAFAIYNRIKASKVPVTTVVNAYCASAAVLVFAAGKKRLSYARSTFLVHELSSEVNGNTSKLRRTVDQQLREQILYSRVLAENSKLSDSNWIKLMNSETYFNEGDAIKYGLCHSVIK